MTTYNLNDIIESVDHIARFVAGLDFEGFLESELVRSGVVQKLAVIGESAVHISEDLRWRYSQVPWPQIVAFRNILIHAYFGIDWNEVWNAVQLECPALREQVAAILASETGESGHGPVK